MTEDPSDRGYRPTRPWGQWQLQSISISNGDGLWQRSNQATNQHAAKHERAPSRRPFLLPVGCPSPRTMPTLQPVAHVHKSKDAQLGFLRAPA